MKYSVVSVTYNDENRLGETIKSIIEQDFDDYEYIIVDGASTDGTINLIERYSINKFKVISEPDKGIYDAMNKGILCAQGDWVIFMNAGDTFNGKTIMRNVAELLDDNDVIYGDVFCVYGETKRLMQALPLSTLRFAMITSHQSTFVKREVIKNNLFNLKYKYAADFAQLSTLYIKGFRFKHIGIAVANVRVDDGATYKHFVKSKQEVLKVSFNRNMVKSIILFVKEIVRFYCVRYANLFFSKSFIRRIKEILHV